MPDKVLKNSSEMKVLVVGKVWPEPNSSAAGSRMMQLIQCFRRQNLAITFATASAKSGFETNLLELGVTEKNIQLNDSSFDKFVTELQPDIVVFDRFTTEEQFGWRVAENCPRSLRILDTEDLHCLREARYQSWKSNEHVDVRDLDISKREIASILRSDLSLVISSYEMKILKEVFELKESLLLHLPFMLDEIDEDAINNWLPFSNRNHFISIGNFHHQPNWNAVLFLKEEIWPRIRQQLPDAELHIFGAYPTQKVQQLHNTQEGFLVKGRADDAKKVMEEAKVLLAPLRFGAGLKGKLIEAMQSGTPSVTTSIGAEAMHNDLPWPGAIDDDVDDFVKAAFQLFQDEDKWQNAQKAGIQIINKLYDKRDWEVKLVSKIGDLQENLDYHRKQNFIGELLQHHTAASTKYMSKWIEAKNDRRLY